MKFSRYLKPTMLEEALALLQEYKDAKLIAGGTDVIVSMKSQKMSPSTLISLNHINELGHIREAEDYLIIGSNVTLREIEKYQLIRRRYSALSDAMDNLGSPLIRNVATIGGNICNAAPSADTAGPLLVHDSIVRIVGQNGVKEIPLDEFFTAPGSTILSHEEIVSEIRIPKVNQSCGSAYHKHSRRKALDIANVGIAVLLSLNKEKICKKARIALGVVAPTPIRAYKAEKFLVNKKIDESVLNEAGEIAQREVNPRDSIRGEAWYRKDMIKVFVRRMGLLAMERAKG